MNLPNKITISRIFLIPICLFVLLSNYNLSRIFAAIIFILAALTDALDGYIARSKNLVTNFGKFLDPLVDKLLVDCVLIALIQLKNISCWIVIIIVSREFIVTGFRLIAAEKNIVIAANNLGKIKTVLQMLMTIVLILNFKNIYMLILKYVLIVLVLFFTILSGIDYIYKNRSVLK